MTRGRGRGRGARGRQQLESQIRRLRHQMTGHTVVPSADPSAFVQRPWNQWTFEITSAADEGGSTLDITTEQISNQIYNKCGLASTAILEIKILDGYAWGATRATEFKPPVMDVHFYELEVSSAGTSGVRQYIRDVGTIQRPARAGYVYPVTDSRNVFIRGETNTPVMKVTSLAEYMTLTARCHVLWKAQLP